MVCTGALLSRKKLEAARAPLQRREIYNQSIILRRKG